MARSWVRALLLVLLLAAVAAAAYAVIDSGRTARVASTAFREFDGLAWRVVKNLGEARMAQQAYVAVSQSPDWWHQRTRAAVQAARADLAELRQRATDGSVLNDLDAASAALEGFVQLDDRVFRQLSAGRSIDGSFLIFSDSLEATTTAVQRVESARTSEFEAHDRALAALRQREMMAAGAAAGLALLVAALLALPRRSVETTEPAATDTPAPSTEGPVPAPAASVAPAAASEPLQPETVPARPRLDRRRAEDLHQTADLCTDFARVLDPQELPGLLARAAHLLDAHGLIVWIGDADGRELRPALTHGYSASAVARLPTIGRDTDNATAAAWRHAELQTVAAEAEFAGAIVAPLITANGCVGVFAAEVGNGREASEPTRAVARIVAAQLASLVTVETPETPTVATEREAIG